MIQPQNFDQILILNTKKWIYNEFLQSKLCSKQNDKHVKLRGHFPPHFGLLRVKLPKNQQKVKKILEGNWLIFALDPKVEMDTETLVLHSDQKFICFVK